MTQCPRLRTVDFMFGTLAICKIELKRRGDLGNKKYFGVNKMLDEYCLNNHVVPWPTREAYEITNPNADSTLGTTVRGFDISN